MGRAQTAGWIAAAMMALPAAAPAAELELGRCAAADGEVEIRRGAEPWDAAAVGEELRSGDSLRSLGRAAARLELAGGVAVRLGQPAQLLVRLSSKEPAARGALSELSVESGAVYASLEQSNEPSDGRGLAVLAGSAASVIRAEKAGTLLRISALEHATEVAVLAGSIEVVSDSDAKMTAEAGQRLDLGSGRVASFSALASGPQPSAPNAEERFFCPGLLLRLAWASVANADAYRLEVSRDASFAAPGDLFAELPSASGVFLARAPGRYSWRVASRVQDHWSSWGPASSFVCEAAQPEDRLVAPANNASARFYGKSPKLTFSWNAVPGARSYKLVVAPGADLNQPGAMVRVTDKTSVVLTGLPAGEYRWGVFVEDGTARPLHLVPRRFVLVQQKVKTQDAVKNWGN